jgi:hypothetical protein
MLVHKAGLAAPILASNSAALTLRQVHYEKIYASYLSESYEFISMIAVMRLVNWMGSLIKSCIYLWPKSRIFEITFRMVKSWSFRSWERTGEAYNLARKLSWLYRTCYMLIPEEY